ncbi:DNA excision repair protein ERCC-1 isoform X2 [Dendrobium catenatum]|uniref:DNA excision repair protein ERCC-1 n=1 Tax=Dendrobium catenatum TaxID=906689 RepID=A0A2I0VXM3_9ASPA|nr:DNA excision repair protein ERCC-1 isoform X2 [Dendrobium catenatum]PKU68161.1 DNA excision repair protein ERCC-1 [Dendrobium catenatum]
MERTQDDEPKEGRRTEKKGLIQIPSYQEVFGISGADGSSSSRPYNLPPPASFSHAFSFIKSSEFYTPPPPMEQAPREASDSAAASCSTSYTSTSASNSYSSVSSSAQNRNAILVSHRKEIRCLSI